MRKNIQNLQAVDIHSHCGPANSSIEGFPVSELHNGSVEFLERTAYASRIGISVNSSRRALMPATKTDVISGNLEMFSISQNISWVYMWAVINPLEPDTFRQAKDLLQNPKVVGLKLHPDAHGYALLKYGDMIYDFAGQCHAVILAHSGEKSCLPEDYGLFANKYPDVKTIIAHLGSGYDGDFRRQLRAIEANTNNNLHADTSSRMSLMANVLEYYVDHIGSERILFGTDSGIYFSPSQRARVDLANISDADKENILYRNALKLFPIIHCS